MSEKFTCPRRIADGMAGSDSRFRNAGDNLDGWTSRSGLVGQPIGCSYCGSLPSDQFMEFVEQGYEVGPTDKSYKFYMKIPHPNPGSLRVISSSNGPGPEGANMRPYKELSRAEKKVVRETSTYPKNFKEGYYSLTTWGELTEAKFYTHHLTEEQGWRFYELQRSLRINWGYPGHPYVSLYIPGPSNADRDDPRLRP